MSSLNIINNKIVNDNLIQSFLIAIDGKSKEGIKILYNEKYKKKLKMILFLKCTAKGN